MLTLEEIEQIRILFFQQGWSKSMIARELQLNRRTVSSALLRDTTQRTKQERNSRSKCFVPYLREILLCAEEEERTLTSKEVFDLACQNKPPFFGYEPVSLRTIERMVKKLRFELQKEKASEPDTRPKKLKKTS